MNVLLMGFGTHGDLHPLVGIGVRLRSRGHHVAFAANEYFAPLIEQAGMEFLPLGTIEQQQQAATDPRISNAQECVPAFLGYVGAALRSMHRITTKFARRGDVVAATSSFALGARVAQDQLGIPLATTHIAPIQIQTAYDSSNTGIFTAPLPSPQMELEVRREALTRINDYLDSFIAPQLNALRSEVGLPPVRGVLRDYINSPDRVIALFPEWLTVRQPDAPPQLRYVGFLRYDEADVTPMPEALEKFLADGAPPIAFTPGSGMWRGQEFFETAVRACAMLGRRGVLLTRYSDHVPAQLPAEVLHVPYAPFSQLLPKCAAVVHNGGIGSCAQAMASGTPQLITPFAFDQHDNAERLVKLGVAIRVDTAEFVPHVVADALQKLTSDPSIARACAAIAPRFQGEDATAQACDLIESLRQS